MEAPRDAAIEFDEQTHSYRILSDPDHKYISVTTWIGTFFKEFDAEAILAAMKKAKKPNPKYVGMTDDQIKEMWRVNKTDAVIKGVSIHDLIDKHCRGEAIDPTLITNNPSWDIYQQFVIDNPGLTLYKTEWRIFDEEYCLAGTIDALFKSVTGDWIFVDWKRCKKFVHAGYKGIGYARHWAISNMADVNMSHYSLQLNTYKFILARRYNINVTAMYLFNVHPDFPSDKPRIVKIEDLSQKISLLAMTRNNAAK